ncbi:DUF4942 domain-containing protein [Gilliamella sp. B3482]|nr:DUF4942 domain-containing protein [Gilliamella sp. B3482]
MSNIMKHLPNNDNQFYPTPRKLATELFSMLTKDKSNYSYILEPSAGKGDLIKYFYDDASTWGRRVFRFSCCEIDHNLSSILLNIKNSGERYEYENLNLEIVGSDFLEFNSIENYDLIIMNPPFKNGDKHLLHALNYVVDGEILCILNAETLKNPYTNNRILLNQKLNELNATIKYVDGGFSTSESERKTDVEVALIHIKKEQDIEKIFSDEYEKMNYDIDLKDGSEVKNIKKHQSIDDMLLEYQDYQKRIMRTCETMFKASYGCRDLIHVSIGERLETAHSYSIKSIDQALRRANGIIKDRYWRKLLDRKEFRDKLTTAEVNTFNNIIRRFSNMEFSRNNINTLYEYILKNGNDLFKNAIFALFDKITRKSSYYPEKSKNIYLFNGWKSNNGYKINSKFILIIQGWPKTWFHADYRVIEELDDIEKVFVYFNNGIYPEIKLSQAYTAWYDDYLAGKTTNRNLFENSMFKVRLFQKGTMHFYVKDEALLRRFNVYVGRERTWLPPDYAMKTYNDCDSEEKRVIDEFEGEKQYTSNLNDPLLTNLNKSLLMIESV